MTGAVLTVDHALLNRIVPLGDRWRHEALGSSSQGRVRKIVGTMIGSGRREQRMSAGEPIENGELEPPVGAATLSRRVAMKRVFGFAILAPAALTLLQACGDDDDDDDGGETTSAPPDEATEEAPEETAEAAETEAATEASPEAAASPAGEATPVDLIASPTSDGAGSGAPESEPLPEPPVLD
jgi:hypothetical protein